MEHYLDNAATTAVLPRARAAAIAAMEEFGNPGSLHAKGTAARKVLDDSRKTLAAALGCKPACLTFTSGGSESTNTALRGAVQKNRHLGKHIVSTQIEHDATLNTLKALQNQGFEVTLVAPEMDGSVSAEAIRAALRPDTAVVSLMAVCNETGAILPLREAKQAMRDICPKALLHVDAVQAFCKIELPMDIIDLMSLSAHKLGGPRGVGCLVVRYPNTIAPLLHGGGQELGNRSGTENLPGIVGMAAAMEDACANMDANNTKVIALREKLIEGLSQIPHCALNGDRENRLPGNVSFCFEGIEGESLLLYLDAMGVCASSGSACTSGRTSPNLSN